VPGRGKRDLRETAGENGSNRKRASERKTSIRQKHDGWGGNEERDGYRIKKRRNSGFQIPSEMKIFPLP